MKQGWTYKKLGDVTAKISDGSHNPPKGIDYSEYPMLSSKNVFFDCFNYDSPRYLSKEEFDLENKRTDISDGDILLTIVGTVGRTCCVKNPFIPFVLQRSVAVLKPKRSIIESRFLMYVLHSLSDFWNIEAKGVAQKGIYLKQLATVPIPVPPIAEQERIVEELDLLSSIIEKKKAQLKELDQLAQSIFYTMFGDPITNEKGWEVIQLGSKCEVSSFKRVLIEDVVDEGVPFIRGTELMTLSKGEKTSFTLFITQEHYEKVKNISGVPKIGDLLIPSINANGCIWILDTEEPRYYKDGRVLWVHVDEKSYSSQALKFIMHSLIKNTYSSVASGATFAELKLFVLRELNTILPPLSLQQEFAEKVEAIERQKALVQQSIAETQTLFDSRMDHWFS